MVKRLSIAERTAVKEQGFVQPTEPCWPGEELLQLKLACGARLPIDRRRLDDRVLNYESNGVCVMIDDASESGQLISIKLQDVQAIDEEGKRERKRGFVPARTKLTS
ncbi:hypothetical protein MHYP_G00055490 [Metynnis hypsauchen]